MKPRGHSLACAILVAALAMPGPALAYIGPGAGLSAIGTALSVVFAVVFLIVGFLWYPLKRLLRRSSAAKRGAGKAAARDN
ncbi:hypothetical protein [Caenispirillum salinarum]|nr:hypothetical protein [Caenispirillum salinarum]